MKRFLYYFIPFFCLVVFVVYKSNKKDILTIKLINHAGATTPRSIINEILKAKYTIKISDKNYNMVFDSSYFTEDNYSDSAINDSKLIKMFYTPEAYLPDINKYNLTIGFNHINDPKYFRLPFYYMCKFNKKISTNYNKTADLGQCNPHKPYFACFLVSNSGGDNIREYSALDGCTARNKMFNKLSSYKRVESGGKHLNNIGKVITKKEMTKWLSQCKFVIAYENQSYDGYITEKPFQAYFAGAIPIYYGHQTAVADINKNAIIYAGDFGNEDDLVEYIKKVDNDDELYCKIWNQNIITNPERNFETVKAKLQDKVYEVIDEKLKKNNSTLK